MKNRLVYERDPEPDVDFDDDDFGEAEEADLNDPYRDYMTFDLTVEETAKKHIRVYAENQDDAKRYITEVIGIENIQMTDIDEYEKEITFVEEDEGIPDYTVPPGLYSEEDEDGQAHTG